MGTLAGFVGMNACHSSPGEYSHLTQDLKTLWELSQEPKQHRGLFLFQVRFESRDEHGYLVLPFLIKYIISPSEVIGSTDNHYSRLLNANLKCKPGSFTTEASNSQPLNSLE